MEGPSRAPLYIGVVLVVLGWAVIGIGWYQAGRQELETGQLPYVISGGFGGFGLLVMGVIAILADVVRQSESKLRRSADELHEQLHELAEVFVGQQERSRQPRPAPAPDRTTAQQREGGKAPASRARQRRRRRPQQRPGSSPSG